MIKLQGDLLGLDLGQRRTGVARLSTVARLAEPLPVITMDEHFITNVANIATEYGAVAVVAGLPRGLDGQETEQTAWARKLTEELKNGLELPIFLLDEAVTTKQAELRAQAGQDIDSVAAGIILEDFAAEVVRGRVDNVSF